MEHMKIDFTFQGQPVSIDAAPEDIAAALDSAIRNNREFYDIAKGVVGTRVAEVIAEEAQKARICDAGLEHGRPKPYKN